MKITCLLINPVHTANRTKHCDPPNAHIYPIGSPVFKGKKQFVQKKTETAKNNYIYSTMLGWLLSHCCEPNIKYL